MSPSTAVTEPANTPVWMMEGHQFDHKATGGTSVSTALKEAGMDWTVRKVPIFGASSYMSTKSTGTLVPAPRANLGPAIQGRHGVQRSSDDHILGVVGNSWSPVQNSEGFSLVDDFMNIGGAHIASMGEIDGGRKVWMQVAMESEMFIAGEQISTYVLFINGHDGRTSVLAAMVDVRFACMNALDWAKKIHRVRHTTKATTRLAEAKAIFKLRDLRSEELAKQGEWLVNQEMTDAKFEKFLEKLMPVPEEQEDKPAGTMIRDRQTQIRKLYAEAPNLDPIRGTAWGALNAVVEYSDYGRKFRDDGTQLKAQFGITSTAIKNKAAGLLLAKAPASVVAPV